MTPEQISPRVAIFAIACCLGVTLFFTSNARAQDRSAKEVHTQTVDTNFEHKYSPISMWVACGFITDDAYEGPISQHGSVWKCGDGATIYDVRDDFTTAHAAETELLSQLQKKGPELKSWRIARTELLDDATIIEFATPAPAPTDNAAPCRWAIIRARDKALSLIYSPDRGHVVDFYQTHSEHGAKK